MNEHPMNFDATPYIKLFIDKEGRWFQNGAEIIHPGIYRLFCDALEQTPEGEYRIKIGRETCKVEVEDAPFVVKAIRDGVDGGVSLLLNDGTLDDFDPNGFWIAADGVPYCRVKGGRFYARFLRPAYYALAQHVVEDDGAYYFELKGKRYLVRRDPSPQV
jgi:hypothetical protein|uniref:DUF1285 domain-containing protein n=1 Tax=Desulfomonile tiedjei TaxID=2358 RepID=A0A7C4ARY7_9BACT